MDILLLSLKNKTKQIILNKGFMKQHFTYILIFSIVLWGSINSFSQSKEITSIFDIQFTTNPGGGTYPSPLQGQTVTTGGIVTGINYENDGFFISSSNGGAWNGIYIYDNDQSVSIGDSIIVTAEVYEYNGLTELYGLTSCSIESTNNPLPDPTPISTHTAYTQEAYESVLVEIHNASVAQSYNTYGGWLANDGSGDCYINKGFLDMEEMGAPLVEGYTFSKIKGVISYFYDMYMLNPRSFDDLVSPPGGAIISIPSQNTYSNTEFEIPIKLTSWGAAQQADSYQFTLEYHPGIITYTGFSTQNTLSAGGTVNLIQQTAGLVEITYSGNFSYVNIQDLIKLHFTPTDSGPAGLNFTSFVVDGENIDFFSLGGVNVYIGGEPIGDTLTVIQRPIQNIPGIVTPGEEFTIHCLADESTTNWSAKIIHKNKSLPVNIFESLYNSDLQRWELTALAPEPSIFELYDLVVMADNLTGDTTRNAVNLIPERKSNYTFVHITDTHLPTHIFYPDPGYLTDTSEMTDFREVIKDINLINPEFVLLTGDLINEGEMEDFENRRVYTKAQRILSELEVPVYLTPGNHDIGGWDDAPPPQGSARRNWWRFFGWQWLPNPPVAQPYYTQNYSFDYGPIHFAGLEAYDNYDSFMYNIYGSTSFTSGQMQWLNNDLQNAVNAETNVVFYHYDFDDQIQLSNMGIDMALWGHIHSNQEDQSHPYNIATAAICDNNRSYRLIRVNNSILEPVSTIYAGSNGNNLSVSFSPSNNGMYDSVIATVTNQQPVNLQDAKLKFIMPAGHDYYVDNGTLLQIDSSGDHSVCYVSFDIPANSSHDVTIRTGANCIEENSFNNTSYNFSIYPNPFKKKFFVDFTLYSAKSVTIELFSIDGRKIKQLVCEDFQKGSHSISCNQENILPGIYFCKVKIGKTKIKAIKIVHLKQ